jgi:peptide/nickel transport system substrate-binding protein
VKSSELDQVVASGLTREALLRKAAAAAVLPSALVAGSQAFAAPGAVPRGTLRAAIPGEPNFIDPANALELTEWSIVRNVYDGLMMWNRNYTRIVPALATSWRRNANGTVWSFNLRRGVQFHDGEPFNSTAARRSIEYYKDKTWGLIWANVKRIDDSNPYRLRVEFSAPSPDLERNMTIAKIISPKLIADKAVGKRAVGTGAYRFVTWTKGSHVALEPNPDYWGAGAFLERIELRFIADQTAAITALSAGDLDLVMKVPPKQLETLKRDPKLHSFTDTSWIEGHLVFRTDQEPVNDVRVRQACAYAIDRKAIVDKVLLGQATVAHTPLPPGTYGRVTPPTRYSYNPDRAKALLSAAGHPDGVDVGLVVFAAIRVLGEEVGQAVAAQLSDVGIRTNLEILEAGVAIKDLLDKNPKNRIYHAEYGWANGGPFHFTIGTALGHPQYKGAALTKLVQQLTTTPDGPRRLRLLAQAQNLFMRELPHLPLYHLRLSDVFRADLVGYRGPKEGYLPVFTLARYRA